MWNKCSLYSFENMIGKTYVFFKFQIWHWSPCFCLRSHSCAGLLRLGDRYNGSYFSCTKITHLRICLWHIFCLQRWSAPGIHLPVTPLDYAMVHTMERSQSHQLNALLMKLNQKLFPGDISDVAMRWVWSETKATHTSKHRTFSSSLLQSAPISPHAKVSVA